MEEKKKANKVETELKKLQSELEILMLGRGEGQKELDRAMNKNV